jgi:type IV pilus assembly protein PilP
MLLSIIQNKRQKSLVLSGIIFCGLISLSQNVFSLETTTQSEEPIISVETSNHELFDYVIEGRSDPFIPFISEKSQTAKMDEILPIKDQLTGMQLFEPGQLNLVAIVMVEDNDFAMVEDTTGKGYVLRSGMEIGKRGIVTSIQSNKVTIEETAFTRAGKKLTSNIVMLLKKEGEE